MTGLIKCDACCWADIGVNKTQSSHWQALAATPTGEVEISLERKSYRLGSGKGETLAQAARSGVKQSVRKSPPFTAPILEALVAGVHDQSLGSTETAHGSAHMEEVTC